MTSIFMLLALLQKKCRLVDSDSIANDLPTPLIADGITNAYLDTDRSFLALLFMTTDLVRLATSIQIAPFLLSSDQFTTIMTYRLDSTPRVSPNDFDTPKTTPLSTPLLYIITPSPSSCRLIDHSH
ncbi:hypothetical protein PGT21_026542 [Puccinia graminis f. sp. tritici]|uniref:Uncharacterized protein n=1 Tax=Puccinia graminis f. sp. tritici TaxID=56615 RepID=A0A5B0P7K8_PUCGR|nr:hypothetical protein PGT21_026542 [Puccinia graminis f. sp. tritici]